MSEKLRLPKVGDTLRYQGTLIEIRDVTPPPPPKVEEYVFELPCWRLELWANGVYIETRCTMNDYAGQPAAAIEEARGLAARFGAGVEVRVIRSASRGVYEPSTTPDLYNAGFPCFAFKRPLGDAVEKVVWSSHDEKGGECSFRDAIDTAREVDSEAKGGER